MIWGGSLVILNGSWCSWCSWFLVALGGFGCYRYFLWVLYDSWNILEGSWWFLVVLGGFLYLVVYLYWWFLTVLGGFGGS